MAKHYLYWLNFTPKHPRLEDVKEDSKFRFRFPTPEPLKKNELLLLDEMAFGYEGAEPLYRGVNLRLEMKDVVGVFGRNGTGKSTLISLVLGRLRPAAGAVELNESCCVGYFAQHHSETLELGLTPYELLAKAFYFLLLSAFLARSVFVLLFSFSSSFLHFVFVFRNK